MVTTSVDDNSVAEADISLVCTSFRGTSNINPAMNWPEQVI